MRVYDILTEKDEELQVIAPTAPLLDAINTLNGHNIGSLLVMENEQLVGIITERDVLHATARHGSDFLNYTVSDVMTRDLITCEREADLDDIMGLMTDKRIRHLPVVEEGELLGIISIGDVVKARLKETQRDAQYMKDYIQGVR